MDSKYPHNCRFLNILHTKSTTTPEIALLLDAEKAFDRAEWDYLFCTLHKFGFGPNFISWIQLLYSSPMARVRTNSLFSSYFPLLRGTRQGCPLSPLLFALSIEPLAIKLRADSCIKGIFRGDQEHKISLYADDLLLYMSEPLCSLPRALAIFECFGNISGYKLNLHKSELLCVNSIARKISFSDFQFNVKSRYVTYLGVKVTHSYKGLYERNFVPLLKNTETDLQRWSNLPLSLIGRINSIKMNILPKFLYLFQCIPCYLPNKYFITLNKHISAFIWNGKSPRIRKDFMQRTRPMGGLALPNFQSYNWAANIRNMLYWMSNVTTETPAWLQIESSSRGKICLSALLSSALPLELYTYKRNPLLYDSLRIWVQCRKRLGLHLMSIKAPICSNHMFPPSMMDSAFKIWESNGLRNIKDLFVDGIFASFTQLLKQFNVPQQHFFRYLQIRHFVKSRFPSFPELPEETSLDKIININVHKRGAIKEIYAIYQIFNLLLASSLKHSGRKTLG